MFDTEWNAHRISTLDRRPHQHFINTSTWSNKKTVMHIVRLIPLCTSKYTSFYSTVEVSSCINQGESGENSQQGYGNFFFHFSNLSVFLLENPTYWCLETAARPIFPKPALNIFAVCSLVPKMNLQQRFATQYATELFMPRKNQYY